MTYHMDYLKGKLEQAQRAVALFKRGIEEEERRTEKFVVRVVVETRGFGEYDWRRTTLCQHDLTIEERDNLIESLGWLERVGK